MQDWLKKQRALDSLHARKHFEAERFNVQIPPGRLAGVFLGWNVRIVDGDWVRSNLYLDFVAGGNPARYAYVPLNELWLEQVYTGRDLEATLLHEVIETRLMIDLGLSYEDGHDTACFFEKVFRENVQHPLREDIVKEYLRKAYELGEPLRWKLKR